MPDFDTRKPQEPNEPNRARIQVVANKLHALLIAIGPRMQLIANRLRSLLIAGKRRTLSLVNTLRGSLVANRLPTLLIGGVLLLVAVAVPVGLLIYPSGGFDHALQKGSQQDERIIPGMQKPLMENLRIDENLKGKLVFQLSGTYQTPSSYAISSMNVNGSGLKRLLLTDTVDPGGKGYSSEDPARSPDLKKIAFTRMVTEYPASVDASESAAASSPRAEGPSYIQVPYVFVMNADGSDQNQFVDRAAAKPDWSPDGKQIVFSNDERWTLSGVSESGVAKDVGCDLYVASVDDPDTVSRLTNEPGCESNPSWSPDGTKIVYTRRLGNDLDIYVIDACCKQGDTNQPQQLTDDDLDDTDPAWSPDGTKIAFTKSEVASETNVVTNDPVKPPESDVYKMDADGSGQTRLTYSKATEAQPTWSPDGTKIAFTRQAFPGASLESDSMNATTGIFTMDSDGTDPALVRLFVSEIASYPEWGGTAQQDKVAKQAIEGEPTEEAIADWRALDARLLDVVVQAYIEQMKTTDETSAMDIISTVLKGLDLSGKEKVVRFLAKAGPTPVDGLSGADLSGVDLSSVDLSDADLSGANLRGANLSNANLSGAYLFTADLSDADLSGANLSRTELDGARLDGVRLTKEQLEQTGPREGPTTPDEWQEKAWEAAARDAITDLAAARQSCAKQHGGNYADCVDFSELAKYGLVIKPTVTYTSAGTKTVVFRTEHVKGGFAYELDTAAGGRIRPIPRFSL